MLGWQNGTESGETDPITEVEMQVRPAQPPPFCQRSLSQDIGRVHFTKLWRQN
jgi:hypothetical protein